jgi:hypothetical protein
VLERPEPRHALLTALAARRGYGWQPAMAPPIDPYDRLADVLAGCLRPAFVDGVASPFSLASRGDMLARGAAARASQRRDEAEP